MREYASGAQKRKRQDEKAASESRVAARNLSISNFCSRRQEPSVAAPSEAEGVMEVAAAASSSTTAVAAVADGSAGASSSAAAADTTSGNAGVTSTATAAGGDATGRSAGAISVAASDGALEGGAAGGAGEAIPDIGIWESAVNDAFQERCVSMGRRLDAVPSAGELAATGEPRNRCPGTVFYGKSPDGSVFVRTWLWLSSITFKLYCFPCKLFSQIKQGLSGDGFNNWKNCDRVDRHEQSTAHREAVLILQRRSVQASRIDRIMCERTEVEMRYWVSILKRLTDAISYLAGNGLAFRGATEIVGQRDSGNYLSALELIAKYDPLLDDHIRTRAGGGRGNVSYLSSTICNELIDLMGDQVLKVILRRRKDAKYYSVCVDHTRDVSKVDQLAVLLRYIETGKPVERFLTYLESTGHTGEGIATALLGYLDNVDIDIQDCRGQTYDGASNMSGRFMGVQTRLKEVNPAAVFVPCCNHGLNVDAEKAVSNSPLAASYFCTVQGVYVFFGASSNRWQRLKRRLDQATLERRASTPRNPNPSASASAGAANANTSQEQEGGEAEGDEEGGETEEESAAAGSSSESDDGLAGDGGRGRVANRGDRGQQRPKGTRTLMPKSHAATRWSAQEASVRALHQGYREYVEVLDSMYNDEDLDGDTRAVAGGYYDALMKLENAFMTVFWVRALGHINAATIAMQKPQRTLHEVVAAYSKLVRLVEDMQGTFDDLEAAAMELCGTREYVSRRRAAVEHNATRDPLDYGRAASATLTARQRFRAEGFVRATDELLSLLRNRLETYTEIARVWGFLLQLPSSTDVDMEAAARNLRQAYPRDFNECLYDELVQFRDFILFIHDEKQPGLSVEQFMYDKLLEHELCSTFPNVHNALTIYLSMMVSNAGAERSFSTLKRIKADDRSCTGQRRLVSLTRLFIEHDLLRQLDFNDMICEFAAAKVRRVPVGRVHASSRG
eukprot:GHVU01102383.1.p1 GENE.GHVU01102383.1~~GHVU01102383.1.p1  ORF type:complete len:959 (-),score=115.48 GHVU01102383.1:303-3179(-)